MSEDKVIAWKNPGTPAPVADALTEILRAGAQRMLGAARLKRKLRCFWKVSWDRKRRKDASVWCVTGICRGGRYKRALGLWR